MQGEAHPIRPAARTEDEMRAHTIGELKPPVGSIELVE